MTGTHEYLEENFKSAWDFELETGSSLMITEKKMNLVNLSDSEKTLGRERILTGTWK